MFKIYYINSNTGEVKNYPPEFDSRYLALVYAKKMQYFRPYYKYFIYNTENHKIIKLWRD